MGNTGEPVGGSTVRFGSGRSAETGVSAAQERNRKQDVTEIFLDQEKAYLQDIISFEQNHQQV